MSYFPQTSAAPRTVITTLHSQAAQFAVDVRLAGTSFASQSITANRAYFYPIALDAPYTIKNFGVACGAGTAGNLDVGIYAVDGTKILSTGSFAMVNGNSTQVKSVTAKTIPPGRYYLAFAGSSGSATLLGLSLTPLSYATNIGVYVMDTAFPLPATATFALPNGTVRFLLVSASTV